MSAEPSLANLPAVDRVLAVPEVAALCAEHGRALVTDAAREAVARLRAGILAGTATAQPEHALGAAARSTVALVGQWVEPVPRRVINLTGTVLHTNLGRAPMPPEAIEAMVRAAQGAAAVELDLETGRRGDRDRVVEDWLVRLTGAEAATVVNNNAAAVLLTLASLAARKEVPVSRGELVEIGGAFRIPDVMTRAGCRLVEVGTTNRTHLRDFEAAIGPRTALLMKVHTSNYVVQGFTAEVSSRALAELAHRHDLPCVHDLGSGTLVDLTRYGLPAEPTPRAAIADGMDLVTFSGDKLLGGPQCGIVVGRRALVDRLKRNPLKRALRVDKVTLAALAAVLRLYADPDRLAERLPSLRLLTRDPESMRASATRLTALVERRLHGVGTVEVVACDSQVGSGALPMARLPSVGIAIRPAGARRARAKALRDLAATFRALPVPVIGRVTEDAFLLDLRCLEDEGELVGLLERLGAG
ncbi:MAG: L-seryl-tRNA(Sec) selenium transferase [Ectothiorhodospiraceae bacterium]|nr:L-seryl-tRNA(Sec) selenium transferase [Ectothiorhodospiraceae bacterium]